MIGHLPMPILIMNNIMRFWDKVNKTDYCWLWTGYKNKGGYGCQNINCTTYIATRISYWMHYHVDPKELEVCHECNNPPCVRPDHLFLGTKSENMKHAFLEGRANNQGSFAPNSILIESDVLKIRALYGIKTQAEIRRMFGVSKQNVNHILCRDTWRHI